MPRSRLTLLLLPLLAGGCVTTTERDCGLYDFDCQDTPTGEALIRPQPGTDATAAEPTPAGADTRTRLQQLERRVERLERRLDALE